MPITSHTKVISSAVWRDLAACGAHASSGVSDIVCHPDSVRRAFQLGRVHPDVGRRLTEQCEAIVLCAYGTPWALVRSLPRWRSDADSSTEIAYRGIDNSEGGAVEVIESTVPSPMEASGSQAEGRHRGRDFRHSPPPRV